jgi:hypothetical protein
VYRPLTGRVLVGICAVIAAWWVLDLVRRAQFASAAVVGLWVVAGVAGLAVLFWRPSVEVDADGVRLLNLVRDVHVPWGLLEGVQTRFALALLADGRRYTSWAAAAPPRPSGVNHPFGTRSASPGSPGADRSGPDRSMPDPRWTPGASAAPAASRDLRADSGAAAFMIEQAWAAWREGAGSGWRATVPSPSPVVVRWRWGLPAVAVVCAVAAIMATY